MPEGDTLHRLAAALRPLLAGRTIAGAWEHGVPRAGLAGREVESVEAQGKHLIIALSGGAAIHVHLGMTGRVARRAAAEVDARRQAQAAMILKTTDSAIVVTNPRTLEVLRTAFLHAHPALSRLGPDLLANPVAVPVGDDDRDAADEAQLKEIVRRARALEGSREIGEVLLDQRVAAGIGNVYKSEVLFLERVDPFARSAALPDETVARLFRRARTLLAANLGPWSRTTTADRASGRLPRRGMGRHHVYRRRLRACFECGTAIAARPQGSALRMTFYCPTCQHVR